jgi:D-alanine-D-alanine ligase
VNELDPIDPGWALPPGTQVVFLALHGTYGEDGTVQEALDRMRVRYTGCGAEASRVAFDKVLTKRRCLEAGVPTAKFEVLSSPRTPWPAGWNPPVVLKPVRQGSSVGLQMVDRAEDWSRSLLASFEHDTEVLMEERICGREATVGILAGQPLPVTEVRPREGVFDYKNKYTPGATEHWCPASFDDVTTRRVQEAALGAFHAVGGRDYSRVDVMVRADGSPVVLEVNTLPGMTELSLLPEAAGVAGWSFPALCQRMVELALEHPLQD